MKVDTTQVLKNIAGQPMKDNDGNGNVIDATLKLALVNSILSSVQKESGVDKVKKYELAKRVYENDEVDLNEDEIKLIKDRVAEAFQSPLIVGQIFEILKI